MILFRLFYLWILFPVFLFVLLMSALFNKKIATGLKSRLFKKKQSVQKGVIWIHASSGEFEYAKPVITALKKKNPSQPILVTYFSPTYAKNIENFIGVDLTVPLPLDLPGPVTQFIKTYQPKALLFSRTDLWPELLYQCRRKNIPTYLFSAVANPNSTVLTKLWREFLWNQLNKIYLVSKEDFIGLPGPLQKKSEVIGDTRFDQVFARLENPKPLPALFKNDPPKALVVAGSTWSEDEEILFKTLEQTKDLHLNWVIAPHEPTENHIVAMKKRLKSLGLESKRLSEVADNQSFWTENEILLIDRVGILAELYTKADVAFVGGSYKAKVHSVMEPLAAGCITFVGPLHTNNGEAMLFKNIKLKNINLSSVLVAENADIFSEKLRNFDQLFLAKNISLKEEIKELIQNYKGATDRLLEQLKHLC